MFGIRYGNRRNELMPFLLKIRENKKKLLTAAIITGEAVNIK